MHISCLIFALGFLLGVVIASVSIVVNDNTSYFEEEGKTENDTGGD